MATHVCRSIVTCATAAALSSEAGRKTSYQSKVGQEHCELGRVGRLIGAQERGAARRISAMLSSDGAQAAA